MSELVSLWRFTLGRALIHTGLRAMPNGRVRSELTALLLKWSEHVRQAIEDSKRLAERHRP